ncbi:hypothetical protein AC1031_020658 [Aphanomyces cochlioides]|nr:hypothetical protein AC1031_020658 [Aphanomyces cochlioides]
MTTPSKRRNYTEEEDVMLLRQVALEMPFQARRGLVMERWGAVASALMTCDAFRRREIDAKKACNRFLLLESERASGISEDLSEKTLLLDDLVAAYDDAKSAETQRCDEQKLAAEQAEVSGQLVRTEALQALGKRKRQNDDDEGSTSNGRFMKVFTQMHEQAQADLQLKRNARNDDWIVNFLPTKFDSNKNQLLC